MDAAEIVEHEVQRQSVAVILRQHLGQLLGIAQVSADKAEYERHVRRIFGAQHEMDI